MTIRIETPTKFRYRPKVLSSSKQERGRHSSTPSYFRTSSVSSSRMPSSSRYSTLSPSGMMARSSPLSKPSLSRCWSYSIPNEMRCRVCSLNTPSSNCCSSRSCFPSSQVRMLSSSLSCYCPSLPV